MAPVVAAARRTAAEGLTVAAAASDGGKWAHRLALGAVLAVALSVRMGWLAAANVDPGRRSFQFDMTFYRFTGGLLAKGAGYLGPSGAPTAAWPPGYPAFLAAVWLGSGGSALAPQAMQVVLGTITCLLTFVLGARLFDRRVGLVAAAILALCPDHVMFNALLLSETLFTCLFTAIAILFVIWNETAAGRSALRWFVLGLLTGGAALVRAVALAFPVVPLAVWLLTTRSLRQSGARFLVMMAGVACAVGPWTLRNAVELGYPVLVATEVGEVLCVAHSPIATGGLTPPGRAPDLGDIRAHMARAAAYRFRFEHLPRPQREVEEMRAEIRRAIHYALTHPWRELALIPRRIQFLHLHGHAAAHWGRVPAADGAGVAPLFTPAWDRAILTLADLHFYVVLGLAALGMPLAFARSRPPSAMLLPLTWLYVTLLHGVLLFGDPRFHIPLLPCLSILAAAAIAAMGRRLRLARG